MPGAPALMSTLLHLSNANVLGIISTAARLSVQAVGRISRKRAAVQAAIALAESRQAESVFTGSLCLLRTTATPWPYQHCSPFDGS